jgi:hypothetical protein
MAELSKIVLILCEKVEKIEKENKEMKSQLIHLKKRKKNSILELLHKVEPFMDVYQWLEKCINNINIQFMNQITNESILSIMMNIWVEELKKGEITPFYCSKENKELYGYVNREWKIVNIELFKEIINKCQDKMIIEYKNWKEKEEQIGKNNKLEETATLLIQNIISFKDSRLKIKKKLSYYLQENNFTL